MDRGEWRGARGGGSGGWSDMGRHGEGGEQGRGGTRSCRANPGRKRKCAVGDKFAGGGLRTRVDCSVLSKALAGRDVFPLVEMHPGLPALAGRKRTGCRLAGVSCADRRAIAGVVSWRAPQSAPDGDDPILSDGLGKRGGVVGQAADGKASAVPSEKILNQPISSIRVAFEDRAALGLFAVHPGAFLKLTPRHDPRTASALQQCNQHAEHNWRRPYTTFFSLNVGLPLVGTPSYANC